MNRIHLAIALALASTAAIAAQVPNEVFVQGRSTSVASHGQTTTEQGAQAINDAAAAAIIGALQTRFDGQSVQFRLGDILSERASLRDITLHGGGEIRFDSAGEWLPIRFDALYDTDTQSVQSPSITLGAQHTARNDGSLPLDGLQLRVNKALTTEFESQQVNFDLQQASIIGGDGQRIVVEGNGVATFDGEGSEDVTIQAIYDTRSGRWIDASYEFGLVSSQNAIASR
ncbi:MAG: hypothetical protein ACOH1L_08245 [Thermomonas sp.]